MILMLADAGTAALDAGAFAVLAAVPAGIVAAVVRTRTGHVSPVGGIVLTVVALVAILNGDGLATPDGTILTAILCAAAVGLVDDVRPLRYPLFAGLLVVPAYLVGVLGPTDSTAIGAVVAAAIVFGVPAMAAFDRRWHREAVSPVLLAGTILGLFVTVPDTEEAVVLLTCGVIVALLGWPLRLVRVGSAGAAASVVLLTWTAMVGGRARDGAVVGACAALGLFVLDPLLRAMGRPSPTTRRTLQTALVLIGTHAVAVLWASRVAGFRDDVPGALSLAILGLVVLGWAWTTAGARARPRPPSRTRSRPAVNR